MGKTPLFREIQLIFPTASNHSIRKGQKERTNRIVFPMIKTGHQLTEGETKRETRIMRGINTRNVIEHFTL